MEKTLALILTIAVMTPLMLGIADTIIETIKETKQKNEEYKQKREHELEIIELNRQLEKEYKKKNKT